MGITTEQLFHIRLEEATENYALSCKDNNRAAQKSWIKMIKWCDKVLANGGEC